MYGDSTRHHEIRAKVIDHMRDFRPLFENHVHKDDVQRRRATRSAANTKDSGDPYIDYIAIMERPGTYGGEPELVAFCQAYDQDVMVHLPKGTLADDHLFYTNEHRLPPKEGDTEEARSVLHITYGGDELTRAHYDSTRTRDGSVPRYTQSPKPQDSRRNSAIPTEASLSGALSARALRNTDVSTELFQEVLQKSKNDLDASRHVLNHRARSGSVSSSHRSSSSKRSLEDDGDNSRRKRADRRKSTRKRTDMSTVSYEDEDGEIRVHSPTDNTPASTQDTEVSSDAAERYNSESDDGAYQPKGRVDDESDYEESRTSKRKVLKPLSRVNAVTKTTTRNNATIKIAERPRSILQA